MKNQEVNLSADLGPNPGTEDEPAALQNRYDGQGHRAQLLRNYQYDSHQETTELRYGEERAIDDFMNYGFAHVFPVAVRLCLLAAFRTQEYRRQWTGFIDDGPKVRLTARIYRW